MFTPEGALPVEGAAPSADVRISKFGLERLDNPTRPELVFGLVAPIGTPLDRFVAHLERALEARGYKPNPHRLSDFAQVLPREVPQVIGSSEYVRYSELMTRGNRLRELTGMADILALFVAAKINGERGSGPAIHSPGVAHIVRQLKHPEEVYRLRSIYGDGFVLMGLYCPRAIREEHLRDRGMSDAEIEQLIRRDEEEAVESGQKLTDTFHLSDVFLEVRGAAAEMHHGRASLQSELDRFLDLLFGRGVVTPTRQEYGMFVAQAAALRSSSLARQVGAAILSQTGEVLSTGTNEVPASGGGQYWGDDDGPDFRDHKVGADLSDLKKIEMVREVLSRLQPDWGQMDEPARNERVKQGIELLKGTQLLNLTEFMRAVHAEMEALSSAVRTGITVRDAILFTTTFPCHGCAKHIVAAGIKEVIYVEPYTKSRALEMHGDAISIDDLNDAPEKVRFLPFVGVAPRKYQDLFARSTKEGRKLKAKDAEGHPVDVIGFRLSVSPLSYLQKESLAAESIRLIKEEKADAFTAQG